MDAFRLGVRMQREPHVRRLRGMKCRREGQTLVVQMAGDDRWGQERLLAGRAKNKKGLGEKRGGAANIQ